MDLEEGLSGGGVAEHGTTPPEAGGHQPGADGGCGRSGGFADLVEFEDQACALVDTREELDEAAGGFGILLRVVVLVAECFFVDCEAWSGDDTRTLIVLEYLEGRPKLSVTVILRQTCAECADAMLRSSLRRPLLVVVVAAVGEQR
ncbi:hypothetical protein E4K10_47245 [Streptomyces sp. T1317-0309]|nr:hypothetical protein E4K10_47245 [Streptomyces sp. T1317-0309]